MKPSNSYLSEWKLLLSPCLQVLLLSGYCLVVSYEYFTLCPCISGNTEPDYHFRCRLLTGSSKLKDSWSNDLSSLTEVSLNGPLLRVVTDGKDSRCNH
jgi:hypothetical protein